MDNKPTDQTFSIGLIEDELFDFDIPLTPPPISKFNSTFTKEKAADKGENDDEVYFGPVGHRERCARAHLRAVIEEETSKPQRPLTIEEQVEIFKEAQLVAWHIEHDDSRELVGAPAIPRYSLDLNSPPKTMNEGVVCVTAEHHSPGNSSLLDISSLNKGNLLEDNFSSPFVPRFKLDLVSPTQKSTPLPGPTPVKRKLDDTSILSTSHKDSPDLDAAVVFSLASPLATLPEELRSVLPKPNIPADESGVQKFGASLKDQPVGSRTVTKTRRSSGFKPPSPAKTMMPPAALPKKAPVIKQSLLKPPTTKLRPPAKSGLMSKRQRRDSAASDVSAASSDASCQSNSGWSTTSSCSSIPAAVVKTKVPQIKSRLHAPVTHTQNKRQSMNLPGPSNLRRSASTVSEASKISRLPAVKRNNSMNLGAGDNSTTKPAPTKMAAPQVKPSHPANNRTSGGTRMAVQPGKSTHPANNNSDGKQLQYPATTLPSKSRPATGQGSRLSSGFQTSKAPLKATSSVNHLKKTKSPNSASPKKPVIGSKLRRKSGNTTQIITTQQDRLTVARKVLSPVEKNKTYRSSLPITPRRYSSTTSGDLTAISSISSISAASSYGFSSPALSVIQDVFSDNEIPKYSTPLLEDGEKRTSSPAASGPPYHVPEPFFQKTNCLFAPNDSA